MERGYNHSNDEYVIDIVGRNEASSSRSSHETVNIGREEQTHELSISARIPVFQPPFISAGSNSRNSSLSISGNSQGRQRSPLNSVLWISVDVLLNVTQIIAAIIVLYLSKNETPRAPLRTWILGYVAGCCGILPLLFWRFKNRSLVSEQISSQRNSITASMNGRVREGENLPDISNTPRDSHVTRSPNSRLKAFVEYFKLALDCFFAIWFIVGNVWIFGWHSSSAEAPNLYRLCIIFLGFSCIGYAMPLILCATICCCLPCLISVIGLREDFSQYKGATQESINALPTYKFKENKANRSSDKEDQFGTIATGTENERPISGEDAVCSICLSKYANNEELRELPCLHLFHKGCVDKWLKINASCPLCKGEIGETILMPLTRTTSNISNRVL